MNLPLLPRRGGMDAALRPQPTRTGRDVWPTPACLIDALVAHVLPGLPAEGPIWEPAAGDGRLANALRRAGRMVVETDIADLDFLTEPPPCGHLAAVCTNPPFNQLDGFIDRGLALLDGGVAESLVQLLRWDHLTAKGRATALNRAAAIDLCSWRPRWIPDSTTGPRWSFAWRHGGGITTGRRRCMCGQMVGLRGAV
jgi:hypothetical protein